MSYYNHGPDGQIIMICQICKTKHHDEPKQVYVVDQEASRRSRKPTYRMATCKMCVCHDCLQLADDPIRAELAKRVMGQTIESRFNLEKALGGVADQLGLTMDRPKRHALQRVAACGCGVRAEIRCIHCDEASCHKCARVHRCDPKRQGEGG
jgi:hypothetical protein